MKKINRIINMSRIHIGTAGWDFAAWQQSYYPEDIPPDWKLAYYSNDFSGIALPESIWRETESGALGQMIEDLDEDFAIYCLVQTAMPDTEEASLVKHTLSSCFRGFIVTGLALLTDNGGLNPADCIVPVTYEADNPEKIRYWSALPADTAKPLAVIILNDEADLKLLRAWFEQVSSQLEHDDDVLILVTAAEQAGEPAIEFMQQLRTLLEIMAIA